MALFNEPEGAPIPPPNDPPPNDQPPNDPPSSSGSSTYAPVGKAMGMLGSGAATMLGGVVDIFAGNAGIKRGEESLGVADAELRKLKASKPSL